jgi:hypothetical protein
MAVEVVGRDVEQGSRVRPELLDAFELEARKLTDDRATGLDAAGERREGVADVPGAGRRHAAALEHGGGQQRGRGLAVGSGDADDRIALLQQAVRELHLGPHRDAGRTCGAHDRRLLRDAGALDEQVGVREQLGIVASEHRFDARRGLPCIRAPIGQHDVHVRRAAAQRLGGREPGAHGAEHDGTLRAGEHGIHLRRTR